MALSVDSFSRVTSSEDVTFGLAGEIDEERWHDLTGIDYLAKPNVGNANQTDVDQFDGESYSVDMGLGDLLVVPPAVPQPREYFHVIQKWEGYVLEVGQDVFLARLVRIVGEGPELEAEIYLEDVEPPDRSLVKPGAVFYWSIGYLIKPSGNRCRASLIRFRRLPPWDEADLKAARAEADELMSMLDAG